MGASSTNRTTSRTRNLTFLLMNLVFLAVFLQVILLVWSSHERWFQVGLDDERWDRDNVPEPTPTGISLTLKDETLLNHSEPTPTGISSTLKDEPTLNHSVTNSACQGKEGLINILRRAGRITISQDLCQELPTDSEVSELYGDGPVVYGLDTCEQYRALLSANANNGTAVEPLVRVAGMFNTGTNAFQHSLNINIKRLRSKDDYAVPWGKHVEAKHKWVNTQFPSKTESKKHVLPVVLVRDPFRWMQSMCKTPYDAEWVQRRCPNLVLSKLERKLYPNMTTFQVKVESDDQKNITDHYDSLVDMWNDWNKQYVDADFPRLIIRFEDTIFHAEKVMELVSQCAGIPVPSPFKYRLQPSKNHGNKKANFISAMVKYGSNNGRVAEFQQKDLEYALTTLDPELMRTLKYGYPSALLNSTESGKSP